VTAVDHQLGITPRTVIESYMTPDVIKQWGTSLASEMRDAELAAHDTASVEVDQRDGLLVLAAFGVCGVLAMRNVERREHVDPMMVIKDAADSTVHVAVPLYQAGGRPVKIGGMTVVVGRKVIGMTVAALTNGWWDCTCEVQHRADGGCGLQDRLERELALLGGWVNRGETTS